MIDDCMRCENHGHEIGLCGVRAAFLCAKCLLDFNEFLHQSNEWTEQQRAHAEWKLLIATVQGGGKPTSDGAEVAEGLRKAQRAMSQAIGAWLRKGKAEGGTKD